MPVRGALLKNSCVSISVHSCLRNVPLRDRKAAEVTHGLALQAVDQLPSGVRADLAAKKEGAEFSAPSISQPEAAKF